MFLINSRLRLFTAPAGNIGSKSLASGRTPSSEDTGLICRVP